MILPIGEPAEVASPMISSHLRHRGVRRPKALTNLEELQHDISPETMLGCHDPNPIPIFSRPIAGEVVEQFALLDG